MTTRTPTSRGTTQRHITLWDTGCYGNAQPPSPAPPISRSGAALTPGRASETDSCPRTQPCTPNSCYPCWEPPADTAAHTPGGPAEGSPPRLATHHHSGPLPPSLLPRGEPWEQRGFKTGDTEPPAVRKPRGPGAGQVCPAWPGLCNPASGAVSPPAPTSPEPAGPTSSHCADSRLAARLKDAPEILFGPFVSPNAACTESLGVFAISAR